MLIQKKESTYKAIDLINSKRVLPQPYNTLLVCQSKEGSVRIRSDIEMILMQQEMLKNHPELLGTFFENIRPDNPLQKYKDKLTDEDLMLFIKSRRFQTPQELQEYSDYLCDVAESEKERFDGVIREFLEAKQAELEKKDTEVEPNKTE